MSKAALVDINGRKLKLSNLDKVMYPAVGFTKGQVIDYYVRIAPAILPHLAGRALTRKRYPNGVDAEFFYEKNAPQHRPDWVKTAPIWSEGNHRMVHYILANDLPTLVHGFKMARQMVHHKALDLYRGREIGPGDKVQSDTEIEAWLPLFDLS